MHKSKHKLFNNQIIYAQKVPYTYEKINIWNFLIEISFVTNL